MADFSPAWSALGCILLSVSLYYKDTCMKKLLFLTILTLFIPADARGQQYDSEGYEILIVNDIVFSLNVPDRIAIVRGAKVWGTKHPSSIKIPVSIYHPSYEKPKPGSSDSLKFNDIFVVAIIGEDAYKDVKELRVIQLPCTVTEIRPRAFMKSGIETVIYYNDRDQDKYFHESFKIPHPHLISIGDGAFFGSNLIDFYPILSVGKVGVEAFMNSTITSFGFKNVDEIGARAFKNSKLRSIDNLSLPIISEEAFAGSSIQTVNLGDRVQTIEKEAFAGSSIQTANLGDGVQIIEKDAFRGCSYMRGRLDIPAHTIESGAFKDCRKLEQVSIPRLQTIETETFSGCRNLQQVTLSDSLLTIEVEAFRDCLSLQSISNLTLRTIGDRAFVDCSALEDPIFWDLSSMGDSAFAGCSSISALIFPRALESIGHYAFSDCARLAHVEFKPGNPLSIGDEAFADCPNLTDINIPGSLASIGRSAFRGCSYLKKINLPFFDPKVCSFGGDVFAGTHPTFQLTIPRMSEPNYGWTVGSDGFSGVFTWQGGAVKPNTYAAILRAVPRDAGDLDYRADTALYGTLLTVKATSRQENEVYFSHWADTAGNVVSTDNPYSYVVTSDNSFTAHFTSPFINITAGAHGTTDFIPAFYPYLSFAEALAKPDDGYAFTGWEGTDGTIVSTDNPYKFTVREPVRLVAKFFKPEYTLTVLTQGYGHAVSDRTVFDKVHSTATVEAFSDSLNRFARWEDGEGRLLSKNNPFIFEVTADMTVKSVFEPEFFAVFIHAENGSVAPFPKSCPYKTTVEAKVVPDRLYKFVKWADENGMELSTSNPYTFSVEKNTFVTAIFEYEVFRITLADVKGGTARADKASYEKGERAELTAVPDPGYRFAGWEEKKTGERLSERNSFMVEVFADMEIVPLFEEYNGLLTFSVKGDGTVKEHTDGVQTVSLTAEPAEGYSFLHWTDTQGAVLSTDNPYELAVTEPVHIIANFTPNMYSVTFSADETGYILPMAGSSNYPFDTRLTIDAVPKNEEDYSFVGWIAPDSTVVSTENPFTFTVRGNTSLHAKFAKSKVFFQTSVRGGGYVKEPAQYYTVDSSVTFTAVPYDGWHFVAWEQGADDDDRSIVSRNARFTFTAGEYDTAYTAVFEEGFGYDANEGIETAVSGISCSGNVLHITGLQDRLITILSVNGKQALQFKADSNDFNYPANLNNGIYIARTSSGKTWKFIFIL
ncbi:Listeria-Bacteroides repeat domain [Bacteroidales bacterium Barb6]|nr:Listeria-Bacteroides repeat domain [Bacteroidales bacterium Barb6]